VAAFVLGIIVVATLNPTHAQKLADARKRRLDVLELQAAELGISTPPQIAIEIEDLRAQLRGEALAEPVSDDERYRSVMRAVMLLSEQVAHCQVRVDRLMWLLPAMLFVYLILDWMLAHLP
jgi:hypothetical protein